MISVTFWRSGKSEIRNTKQWWTFWNAANVLTCGPEGEMLRMSNLVLYDWHVGFPHAVFLLKSSQEKIRQDRDIVLGGLQNRCLCVCVMSVSVAIKKKSDFERHSIRLSFNYFDFQRFPRHLKNARPNLASGSFSDLFLSYLPLV